MKVYMFYLKTNNENDFVIPSPVSRLVRKDKYNNTEVLYAFTKSKELKDIFKSTRNMDLFTIDKINISYEEYNDLLNKYGNSCYYDRYSLKTRCINNGINTVGMKDIYCTSFEYNKCITVYPFDIIDDDFYINELLIFVDKYFNSKYKDIIEESPFGVLYYSILHPFEDYNFDELAIDEISVFVRLFHKTYRKEI